MLTNLHASIVDGASARLAGMAGILGLGKRVRERREALGLSQAALAGLIGVTRSAISQLESGLTKGARPEHLVALARVLNSPVDYLVHGKRQAEKDGGPLMVSELASEPYLATLTEGEVELLHHLRSAGGDHLGRNKLARQALAVLRAMNDPPTEPRKPRH